MVEKLETFLTITGNLPNVAMMTFFIDVNNVVTSSFADVNNAMTWILNASVMMTTGNSLSVAMMTITFFVDVNIDIDFRVFL